MRSYDERLTVPASWWLLGGVSVAILGGELWAGAGALAAVVTYGGLVLLCGGTLLYWGSAKISVTAEGVRAGGHLLPHEAIGDVTPLDERQTKAVRGQHADPAAFLLVRPYLKRAVYIEVADPDAATPYWLVGTRRPGELAATLRSFAPSGASDRIAAWHHGSGSGDAADEPASPTAPGPGPPPESGK